MKCVFNRCFILADVLKRTRGIIDNFENNPESMNIIRTTLSTCTEAGRGGVGEEFGV